ncbi:hypothetical protein Bpfe_007058 [Biomphalaria pfeifferi]|uniref:DRBM domain-containing protein n=1 Tax=Biomphalaria pfeifferi TaxID=112525 RepID=A0AAD8BYZ8_BIOPF|nr:hypothetical protein Bpfe_007058 [Biomphalaria pfeifferi]
MNKNFSTRTIYNGPFILPGQKPLELIASKYVNHELPPFCYTSETPLLDDSCYPVFNLSFLDESNSEKQFLPPNLNDEYTKYVVQYPAPVLFQQVPNEVHIPFSLTVTNQLQSNNCAKETEAKIIDLDNLQIEQKCQSLTNLKDKVVQHVDEKQICHKKYENSRQIFQIDHRNNVQVELMDHDNNKTLCKDKALVVQGKNLEPMDQYPRRRKRLESPYDYFPKHFREDDRLHSRVSYYERTSHRFSSRDYYADFLEEPYDRFDRHRSNYFVPDHDFDAYPPRLYDRERHYSQYNEDMGDMPNYLDIPSRLHPQLPPYKHVPHHHHWDFPFEELDLHYQHDRRSLSPSYIKHWPENDWEQRRPNTDARMLNYRKYPKIAAQQTQQGSRPSNLQHRPGLLKLEGHRWEWNATSNIPPLCDFDALKSRGKQNPQILNQNIQSNKAHGSQQQKKEVFLKSKSPSSKAITTATVLSEDSSKVTFAKHLHKFITKLKKFPEKENSIQTYENCLMSCHLPLKTFYVVTDVIQQNKTYFSGVLYINDLFITRTSSANKKSLKHSVYESAVDLLKTKTVNELLAQVDPGVDKGQGLDPFGGNYETQETLQNKLSKLQEYIKKSSSENQPFTTVNLAFTESRCGLRLNFDYEAIQTERGVHMYTKAILFIEDQPFVDAIALTRKEAKSRACQKAITIFCESEIETIVKKHFISQVPTDDIPKEIQELIKKHREKNALLKQSLIPTEQEYGDLLDKMINDLNSPVKKKVNAVMTIDKNCLQLKIKLLTVYKMIHLPEESVAVTCDLYIVDRFIAQGTGPNRKIAQMNAYNKGAEILQNCTGLEVLTNFPKFDESELKKPDVIDIVYKGYSKMYESNLCRLNRLKQLPEGKRKRSDLVLIEHEEWSLDRQKHSHCILNQSATQCGCLLEWITEPENGCFRCTIKLQGEEISSCLAKQRKVAVSLASSKALFQLFESQPLVHRSRAQFASQWCSRNELVLLASSFTDGEVNILLEATEIDLNIAKAIETKLDVLFNISTLEEFITAPDWLPAEKKYLRNICNIKGLRVLAEIYCEETVFVVSQKYDLLQIVEILKYQPIKTHGRYSLVPDEEKPSYNDIAGELAANDSLIKKFVGASNLEPAPDATEEDSDPQEEITLDSDSEPFITANTVFVDNSSVTAETVKTADTPINLAEIPLPKSTSTPSRPTCNLEKYTREVFKPNLKPVSMNQLPAYREINVGSNEHVYKSEPLEHDFKSEPLEHVYKSEPLGTESSTYFSYAQTAKPFNTFQPNATSYISPQSFVPIGSHYNVDVEAGRMQSEDSKDWCYRLKNTVVKNTLAHWQTGYQHLYDISSSGNQQPASGVQATYTTHSEI